MTDCSLSVALRFTTNQAFSYGWSTAKIIGSDIGAVNSDRMVPSLTYLLNKPTKLVYFAQSVKYLWVKIVFIRVGEFKESSMAIEIRQIFSAIKKIAIDGSNINNNQDIQELQGQLNKLIERLDSIF